MTALLTAAQIVKAYEGYPLDVKVASDEHIETIRLREIGNSNRAWNRPAPAEVIEAYKAIR